MPGPAFLSPILLYHHVFGDHYLLKACDFGRKRLTKHLFIRLFGGIRNSSCHPGNWKTEAVVLETAGIDAAIPEIGETEAVISETAGIDAAIPEIAGTEAAIPDTSTVEIAVPDNILLNRY